MSSLKNQSPWPDQSQSLLPGAWGGRRVSTRLNNLDRVCLGRGGSRGKPGAEKEETSQQSLWKVAVIRSIRPGLVAAPAAQGCLCMGEGWCLQGAGTVDKPSRFLCGGRMCKLTGHLQKLPGAPCGYHTRRMRPLCLAPCLVLGLPNVCADSFAEKAFSATGLCSISQHRSNSQAWAWAGGATGLPSCSKGAEVPKKGRWSLLLPTPTSTARLSQGLWGQSRATSIKPRKSGFWQDYNLRTIGSAKTF